MQFSQHLTRVRAGCVSDATNADKPAGIEKVKMQNAKWGTTTIKMLDETRELTRFPPLRASHHFAFFNSHFAFCIHLHDRQITCPTR
jgi:hypothetical protein